MVPEESDAQAPEQRIGTARMVPTAVASAVAGAALSAAVLLSFRSTDVGDESGAVSVASSLVAASSSSALNAAEAAVPRPPKPFVTRREKEREDAARVDFAKLYVSYLLKTYYVYERGFCKPLLHAICKSLLSTELLNRASTCERVPNAALVLAIGRYQHKTKLPVDGKAGPETVRLMLGGAFKGRRAMAAKYCPGWKPPGGPSSDPTLAPAPPTTIDW